MTKVISIADKLVKVGLGIAKLVVGDSRLDAAKDIMAVVTNGKALHDEFTGPERDIASRLAARAEARFEALAGKPDFPADHLATAKVHMEQALDHCVPEPAVLAELGLDPGRIAEAMIATAIAAAPEAEFAVYYASDRPEGQFSRRYFLDVTIPFLKELLPKKETIDRLTGVLWREVLERLGELKDDTIAIRSVTESSLSEIEQIKMTLNETSRAREAPQYAQFFLRFMPIIQYIEDKNIDPYELIEAHRERKK